MEDERNWPDGPDQTDEDYLDARAERIQDEEEYERWEAERDGRR